MQSTFYAIEKPENCCYMSVSECLYEKALMYEARGRAYMAAGNTPYAMGSFAKAMKKLLQSKNVSLTLDAVSDRILDPMITNLSERVATSVLQGEP